MKRFFLLWITCLLVSACGGGGSSPSASTGTGTGSGGTSSPTTSSSTYTIGGNMLRNEDMPVAVAGLASGGPS